MTRDQIELLCRNIQAITGDWKPEESILLRHDAEQRQVINTLNDLVKAKEARCDRYQVEITKLRETLTALHALVKGECPRLLNEDSGGDAQLAMEIEQALKEHP